MLLNQDNTVGSLTQVQNDLLLEQWNIDSTLNRDKKYFRIRIRVNSVLKFKNIIESYVIDSMKYKLA